MLELNRKRELGFDINQPLDAGSKDTPLHRLASGDQIQALTLLIRYGADPNAKNSRGDTPLMIAVNAKRSKAVDAIAADKRTDFSIANSRGETALTLAILKGSEDHALAFAKRLTPDTLNAMRISGHSIREAALSLDLPVAYRVSRIGVPPQVLPEVKRELAEAISRNSALVAKELLQTPKLKLTDEELRKMFDVAVQLGNVEAFVEVMRKYPQTLAWRGPRNENLAHVAARQGSISGLAAARDIGVKFTDRDNAGETVLESVYALKKEWEKGPPPKRDAFAPVLAYLEDPKYAKPSAKKEMADLLAKQNLPTGDRVRWIYAAIQQGKGPELVKAYGLDWLSRLASRQSGLGLFHLAVLANDPKAVRALLDLGLDPKVVEDEAGLTAGRLARIIDNSEINVLLKFTASSRSDYQPAQIVNYTNEETLLRLIELGLFNSKTLECCSSPLNIANQLNSVALIEAAYARGHGPYSDGTGSFACAQTLEDPNFAAYDLRVNFGAFKKDSSKSLSAKEVTRALTQRSKLDVGLQVAIADPNGHFVARVKASLIPEDIHAQKEDRHPQCAKSVATQGVSGRESKAGVGDVVKSSGEHAPVANPAK